MMSIWLAKVYLEYREWVASVAIIEQRFETKSDVYLGVEFPLRLFDPVI